ncbi:signal peptidase 22kDa subunit [Glomus cerebriforme]|uniref:Signal peptidase subunit 3 n=1 Tax=Glomus cerebriforme TaxID=658196 RepID=A0A397T9H1_9GLOM|nr:signal peptidase 22kDa subunit [Glomus cerebriforme]
MYIIFRRIIPFFTRALLVCLFISFFTTIFDIYYSTKSPSILNFKVTNIKVWLYDFEETEDKSLREFAFVTMDIDADFTSLFTFNTQAIFVSVIVEYETPTHKRNQIILWSTTITKISTSRIKSYQTLNKYSLYDITQSFNGVNGTYILEWNVIPKVGMIKYGRADSDDAKFIYAFPRINT